MTVSNYNRPTPTPEWHPLLSPLELAVDGAQASLDRLDFTLAQATAALCVIDDRLFDLAMGDMHVLTPAEQWEEEGGPIAELELAMLDTCLGAPHSDAEAGCLLVELEERGIYVRPALCADCGRTHLKAGW